MLTSRRSRELRPAICCGSARTKEEGEEGEEEEEEEEDENDEDDEDDEDDEEDEDKEDDRSLSLTLSGNDWNRWDSSRVLGLRVFLTADRAAAAAGDGLHEAGLAPAEHTRNVSCMTWVRVSDARGVQCREV